jgi:hypothetical protein
VQAAALRADRHATSLRFFILIHRVSCSFIEAKVSTLVLTASMIFSGCSTPEA